MCGGMGYASRDICLPRRRFFIPKKLWIDSTVANYERVLQNVNVQEWKFSENCNKSR